MRLDQLDQLVELGKRAGQPIDLQTMITSTLRAQAKPAGWPEVAVGAGVGGPLVNLY